MPHRTPSNPAQVLKSLQQAARGLMYPSESDRPFEVFHWPDHAADPADALQRQTRAACVEAVDPDDFFAELATFPQADRFAVLQNLLNATFAEWGVFRVLDDEPRIAVYLVGRLASGGFAGLRTESIET